MNLREAAQQATPREQLLKELMDSRVPKTEREHAAAREIERLRAALADAMIKDNLTVEPVAYVTGYSKGYATVQPIDPCLLMPVGMSLYRSPPTISKTETVDPVAWMSHESMHRLKEGGNCKGTVPVHLKPSHTSKIPLYTAPPKSKPLTENQIRRIEDDTPFHECPDWVFRFTREIERAHEIGDKE